MSDIPSFTLKELEAVTAWLPYSFGVGTPHLDERAESHGVTRVFTGWGLLNPEPG